MERNVDLARNKIFHLEESLKMCDIYNEESVEKVLKTINKLLDKIPSNITF